MSVLLALLSIQLVGWSFAMKPGQMCENGRYAHCSCDSRSFTGYHCAMDSYEDVEVIAEAFRSSHPMNHRRLSLYFGGNVPLSLPADLLGQHRVRRLDLRANELQPLSPQPHQSYSLGQIDVNTFRSLRHYAEEVILGRFAVNDADLGFLNNFTALRRLGFSDARMEGLTTLPHLPALRHVSVRRGAGLRRWPTAGLQRTPRLVSVEVRAMQLGDRGVERVVASLPASVVRFSCIECGLTHLPTSLHRRSQSWKVLSFARNNGIKVLRADELPFLGAAHLIDLSSLRLRNVEFDTFRGNFSSTTILLSSNDLTRLESHVFAPVLESMARGKGLIDVSSNPIICDCGLAWLVRQDRNYLPHVSGTCRGNSIPLNKLNSEDFTHCSEH